MAPSGVRAAALPFVATPAAPPSAPAAMAPALLADPAPLAAPMLPMAPAPPAPPTESPWAGGALRFAEASAPGVILPRTTPDAALQGAAAASTAAAAVEARPAQVEVPRPRSTGALAPAQPPAEIVELLWFDPEAPARVRARWPALAAELQFEPLDPINDLPSDDADAVRDHHVMFGVLTDGPWIDASAVGRAVREAVNDKGRFTPPLVLVSGELHLPFDEVEVLKAVVAVVSPTAAGDKRLKDLVDAARELLATPYLQSAGGAVERLTRDLKDQAAQASKALAHGNVDAYVERALLLQRKYQVRKVFGEEHLRGLVAPATSGETPVPAYLPKKLEAALPMMTSMRVRLIAEAHVRQDQYEGSGHALKARAVGRVLPAG
jgi:hypothetical protein